MSGDVHVAFPPPYKTQRMLGDETLSLPRDFLIFFITFFICLFRDDLFHDFYHLFMTLLFYRSFPRRHRLFLFLSSSAPSIYMQRFWGSPKTHLLWRFRDTSTIKKMLGVGPSVRFFG